MNSKEIIQTVSKKLNIPYEVVNKAYSSYWEFIKTTIEKLPLKEDYGLGTRVTIENFKATVEYDSKLGAFIYRRIDKKYITGYLSDLVYKKKII